MRVVGVIKKVFFRAALLGICTVTLIITGLALYLSPQLPSVESLKTIKLQTPLQIYSADNKLIAEFGEKRRTPINVPQIPPLFIGAILAAEDDRFEEHHGVDIKSLLRAAFQIAASGSIQSGGSTITMQVAKNYFLSQERTFSRKFNEILLALQIEQKLSKEEILELYVNKIYLGNRAYGIQAAAQVYYGKGISELRLAQLAMIAGLPKAPSKYNPIANPERALVRRDWILQRMHKLGYINQEAYQEAVAEPNTASYHGLVTELDAPYVAEMVRAELLTRYPAEELYTSGLRVYTTLDSRMQRSATAALRKGLLAYDRRHGYRGAESHHPLKTEDPVNSAREKLKALGPIGVLLPAIVVKVEEKSLIAVTQQTDPVEIDWEGLKWARRYINNNAVGRLPASADELVKPGDQIRIMRDSEDRWTLAQIPNIQGALVSLRPQDGALMALVGGFNFHQNKFNRATQAARQPGSNFKPFLYTAALENGYTAASIINDAPVVFDDDKLESTWRPENYSGQFFGPTRLRQALYQSRNLVSIRLLRDISIPTAISYVSRFGFAQNRLPRDLSLALGSAEFTPLEIATGYTAFANGGYRVFPYFIKHIEDNNGNLVFSERPVTVCAHCDPTAVKQTLLASNQVTATSSSTISDSGSPSTEQTFDAPAPLPVAERIIEPRTAYIIDSILKDVIAKGTGRRARNLGRSDIAGKTGTTNDQKDAWFSGYNPNLVTSVWVGFDQPQPLGSREVGGFAALPIWIDHMQEALAGTAQSQLPRPNNLVSVRIDPKTGLRAQPGQANALFEVFKQENAPAELPQSTETVLKTPESDENIAEQIF